MESDDLFLAFSSRVV